MIAHADLWARIAREYRRLRAIQAGACFGRLEALGRAIGNVERDRRWER